MQSHKVIISDCKKCCICTLINVPLPAEEQGDWTVCIANVQVRRRLRRALTEKLSVWLRSIKNKEFQRQECHIDLWMWKYTLISRSSGRIHIFNNMGEHFSPDGFNNMHERICCFFSLFFFLSHSFFLFCDSFWRLKIPATVQAVATDGYYLMSKNIKNASNHKKSRKVRDTLWPPSQLKESGPKYVR